MSLPDLRFRLTANDADAQRALNRARTHVRGLGTDARRSAGDLRAMAAQTATIGRSSGALGRGVQNAAFQVGDFAVQVGAGTSALRAMSMQLPQLLGGFGPIGAVVAAVAATVTALALALSKGGDAARDMADGLNEARPSLEGIRGQVSQLQGLQEALNTAMRAAGSASSASASTIVANSRAEFEARRQVLGVELELLRIRQGEIRQGLTNLRDQQDNASALARARAGALGPGATERRDRGAEGFVGSGVSYDDIIQGAGIDTGAMADRRRQITRLEAELKLLTIGADEASAALDGVFNAPAIAEGGGAGGGGAGGGGRRERKTPVERAIERQKTAMEELVDATRGALSEALGAWGGYFDNLVSMSGSQSQRLLGIAKTFGAAQALVDTWRAHNQVLADPRLPYWAKIAAAAKVLASGLGAVNAIRSVTAGGGGGRAGGGAAGGAQSAPPQPLQAILNLQGPFAAALGSEISPLFDRLREEAGDRGYVLAVRTGG